METCKFCQIARSELSVHEVFRNELIVAFMDRGPIRPGHIQVIPVSHYEYFDDLPIPIANEILKLGQKLARVQKIVLKVDRVGFLFTGGDIAHAHAHLVPLHEKQDITSRRYIEDEELTFKGLPNPGHEALDQMAKMLADKLND